MSVAVQVSLTTATMAIVVVAKDISGPGVSFAVRIESGGGIYTEAARSEPECTIMEVGSVFLFILPIPLSPAESPPVPRRPAGVLVVCEYM
jgi:hypothetical protein